MNLPSATLYNYLNPRLVGVILLASIAKANWAFLYAAGYIFQSWHEYIFLVGIAIQISTVSFIFYHCIKWNSGFGRYLLLSAIFLAMYFVPAVNFHEVSLRFFLNREAYLSKIKSDISDSPKFLVFDWGEYAGFPAGGAWENLIYDETDQMGLPPESRSPEWSMRHGGYATKLIPQCNVRIVSLGHHFFFVAQSC
ncbi:MAG: hypothetical protein JO216_06165 [Hyphomicrobiales bacterium]|nr:hypothetical protein [Hyphomicrobiales bacterium]